MGRIAKDPTKIRRVSVIMVQLKVEIEGVPEFTFFGSKKAVMEYFGEHTLGLKYCTFKGMNCKGTPYENRICKIYDSYIITDKSPDVIERQQKDGRRPIEVSGGYQKKKEAAATTAAAIDMCDDI